MKNKHQNSLFYNKHSFSRLGAHFVCKPKIMTYRQVFQKIFLVVDCPIKKLKVSEAERSGLRILTGRKHRQMKLLHLQKVRIFAFGLLV